MSAMTFTSAVADFERASPWLGPQHAPAVAALRAMATTLDDGEMPPAMIGQFGLTFRALSKERPTAAEVDPLAKALEDAGAA